MENVSVNQFREELKYFADLVVDSHDPIKVTRRNGKDFIILSAEDWQREQESLYVLQNSSLMKQIAASMKTHASRKGFIPPSEVTDEILSVRG